MNFICPVCGYPDLSEEPYSVEGYPSYEICSCCGYQFGYDDLDQRVSYLEYRKEWIENGFKWFNKDREPPLWNPIKQLSNIKLLD